MERLYMRRGYFIRRAWGAERGYRRCRYAARETCHDTSLHEARLFHTPRMGRGYFIRRAWGAAISYAALFWAKPIPKVHAMTWGNRQKMAARMHIVHSAARVRGEQSESARDSLKKQ